VNQAIEPNVPTDMIRQDYYTLPDTFSWDTLDLEDPNIVRYFLISIIRTLSLFDHDKV